MTGADAGTTADALPVPATDAELATDVTISPASDGAPAVDVPPTSTPTPDAAPASDVARPADVAPDQPTIACGNGVVERGETCEPVAECTRQQAACKSDQNTVRTGTGSPTACTFRCQQSARPCGPADGACPAGCGADPDCLPRPDDCVHIEWCRKPFQPNQNQVICRTADNARCTDAERIAECAREASSVCGAGHARPVQYVPPIGGRPSG